ncbi:unnamed protein product [Gordionus sp. m RMFG-2023]
MESLKNIPLIFFLYYFLCVYHLSSQSDDFYDSDAAIDSLNDEKEAGLFPVVLNLASGAKIWTNATCGQHEPETYCKLMEHVEKKPFDWISNKQCDICDGKSAILSQRHPIEYAIDGTQRWWQSPSIAKGYQYQFVDIIIDLRQVYQIYYLIIKSGPSPRPGNWILERSIDGITFKPWQFFATNPYECNELAREYYYDNPQGMKDFSFDSGAILTGTFWFEKDDQVICTKQFSELLPLEDGEIHVSLINGRPGISGPSQTLIEFTSARYIRLRLTKIRTLSADFMTMGNRIHKDLTPLRRYNEKIGNATKRSAGEFRKRGGENFRQEDYDSESSKKARDVKDQIYNQNYYSSFTLDQTVSRRYYYSIRDISIGGQCICHGHAELCLYDYATEKKICKCNHNTCGESCEVCCPGFYQKRWSRSTSKTKFICQACNCNSHSTDCVYDANVDKYSQSMNSMGLYEGGGVCVRCQHNTAGINCERCQDGYFNPQNVPMNTSDACRQCQCHGSGVASDICLKEKNLMNQLAHFTDMQPGDCFCKPNFRGPKCDKCAKGYRNFPECTPCPCNIAGMSDIDDCDGDNCKCKKNVRGDYCQICADGYFGLSEANAKGCDKCFCFGLSKLCDSQEWFIKEVSHMRGWSISDIAGKINVPVPSLEKSAGRSSVLSLTREQLETLMMTYTSSTSNSNSISNEDGVSSNLDIFRSNQFWHYYWSAPPDKYIDDYKLYYSRGLKISFDITYYADAESPDSYASGNALRHQKKKQSMNKTSQNFKKSFVDCPFNESPLLIIENRNGRKIGYYDNESKKIPSPDKNPQNGVRQKYVIEMDHKKNWFLLARDKLDQMQTFKKQRLSHKTFATILAGAKRLLIRSQYCNSQSLVYFRNFLLTHASPHDGIEATDLIGIIKRNDSVTPYHIPPSKRHIVESCHCQSPGSQSPRNGSLISKWEEDKEDDYYLDYQSNQEQSPSNDDYKANNENNYTGLSCQSCRKGFRRVYDITYKGLCKPCNCNGHSDSCDSFTGKCLSCKHNTRGFNCDFCENGFYELAHHLLSARLNKVHDHSCLPCKCPFADKKHPTQDGLCTAAANSRIDKNDDFVCTRCPPGHTGTKCERCMQGWYGDPIRTGQFCIPCQCNGNNLAHPVSVSTPHRDKMASSLIADNNLEPVSKMDDYKQICEAKTGVCLNCHKNTMGKHCELCRDGFYDARPYMGCKVCDCYERGSISDNCDKMTGQCICKDRYVGKRCDTCQPGFGDVTSGCLPCKCDEIGSFFGSNLASPCNQMTGNCVCKLGVSGAHCDKCLPGHYGLNHNGCDFCRCNQMGSNGTDCDSISGQCNCLPNVVGRTCDTCKSGHWGIHLSSSSFLKTTIGIINKDKETRNSTMGCTHCLCNPLGSESLSCTQDTGECACKYAVEGKYCDKCSRGFYGNLIVPSSPNNEYEGTDSSIACRPCPKCRSKYHMCDRLTGVCKCPPNTMGEKCDKCLPYTWKYDSKYGCKACDCNPIGSKFLNCSTGEGICTCRSGYSGRYCDTCLFGYFDFPRCRKCRCNVVGTEPNTCAEANLGDGPLCQCADDGQCNCKKNARGKTCNRCQPNTFGLSPSKPEGCTSCFCFGRSNDCELAPYDTSQVTLNTNMEGNYLPPDKEAADEKMGKIFSSHSRPKKYEEFLTNKNDKGVNDLSPLRVTVIFDQSSEKGLNKSGGNRFENDDNDNGPITGSGDKDAYVGPINVYGEDGEFDTKGTYYGGRRKGAIDIRDSDFVYAKESRDLGYDAVSKDDIITDDLNRILRKRRSPSDQKSSEDQVFTVDLQHLSRPNLDHDQQDLAILTLKPPVQGQTFYWNLPKQFLGDKILSYGSNLSFKLNTFPILPDLDNPTYYKEPLVQVRGGNGKITLLYFPILPVQRNSADLDIDSSDNLVAERERDREKLKDANLMRLADLMLSTENDPISNVRDFKNSHSYNRYNRHNYKRNLVREEEQDYLYNFIFNTRDPNRYKRSTSPSPAAINRIQVKNTRHHSLTNKRPRIQYDRDIVRKDKGSLIFRVPLLPSKRWRWSQNPNHEVTREILMLCLQSVSQIAVRANFENLEDVDNNDKKKKFVGLELASISHLALGIGVLPDKDIISKVSPIPVESVELCRCKTSAYAGTSCQNIGSGYYRSYQPRIQGTEQFSSMGANNADKEHDYAKGGKIVSETWINSVIGSAEICDCNGYGGRKYQDGLEICDSETGNCLSCNGNTAGPRCGSCALGYYYTKDIFENDNSAPRRHTCLPCACPLTLASNSFSPTCRPKFINLPDHPLSQNSLETAENLICDACAIGYAGDRCQFCAPGYHGSPTIIGGKCQPCECSLPGSADNICHNQTGACNCLPGIMGYHCDSCSLPGHAITDHGGKCISCYVGCSADLMYDLDILEENLKSKNLSQISPMPWGRLNIISNITKHYKDRVLNLTKNDMAVTPGLNKIIAALNNQENSMNILQTKDQGMKDALNKTMLEYQKYINASNECNNEIRQTHNDLINLINSLSIFTGRVKGRLQDTPFHPTMTQFFSSDLDSNRSRYDELDEIHRRENSTLAVQSLMETVEAELEIEKHLVISGEENNFAKEFSHEIRMSLFDGGEGGMGMNASAKSRALQALVDVEEKIEELSREFIKNPEGSIDKALQYTKSGHASDEIINGLKLDIMAITEMTNGTRDNLRGVAKYLNLTDETQDEYLSLLRRFNILMDESSSTLENLENDPLAAPIDNIDMVVNYDFLGPSKSHSLELEDKALLLTNLLGATKIVYSRPMDALNKLKSIYFVVHNNSIGSFNSSKLLDTVLDQVMGYLNDHLNVPNDIFKNGQIIETKANVFNSHTFTGMRQDINNLQSKMNLSMEGVNEAYQQLLLLDQDHFIIPNSSIAMSQAVASLERADDLALKVNEIKQKLNGEFKDNFSKIASLSSARSVKIINDQIFQTRNNVSLIQSNAMILEEKIRGLNDQRKELEVELESLKDIILMAKLTASNIRVSMQSATGNCQRSYDVHNLLTPRTINEITLAFKPSSFSKDAHPLENGSHSGDDTRMDRENGYKIPIISLVNYDPETNDIGDANPHRELKNKDRLSLFLKDKILVFEWSIGNNSMGTISDNSVIFDDKTVAKDVWYTLRAKRIGNKGVLRVSETLLDSIENNLLETQHINSVNQSKIQNTNPVNGIDNSHNYPIFKIDKNTVLQLGNYETEVLNDNGENEIIRNNGFRGCVSDLTIDGNRIGLWSFNEQKGACDGCLESPKESREDLTYQFNGRTSYAKIPQISRYNSKRYSLTFQFKTHLANSLLFFAQNREQEQYFSIELKGGKVLFKFTLDGKNVASMQTAQLYNTGEWIYFSAERLNYRGHLKVNNEIVESSASPYGTQELALNEAELYFGGTPPGFNVKSNWNLTENKYFMGCMRLIQIGQTSIELFEGQIYGLEAGCVAKPIYTVNFVGSGFADYRLKRFANDDIETLSLTFSTLSADGLILLMLMKRRMGETNSAGSVLDQAEKEGEEEKVDTKNNFVSIHLLNGQIYVQLGNREARRLLALKSYTDYTHENESEKSSRDKSRSYSDGKMHVLTLSKRRYTLSLYIDDEYLTSVSLLNSPPSLSIKQDAFPHSFDLNDTKLLFSSLDPFSTSPYPDTNNPELSILRITSFDKAKNVHLQDADGEMTEMEKIQRFTKEYRDKDGGGKVGEKNGVINIYLALGGLQHETYSALYGTSTTSPYLKPFKGCVSDIVLNDELISLHDPSRFEKMEFNSCSLTHRQSITSTEDQVLLDLRGTSDLDSYDNKYINYTSSTPPPDEAVDEGKEEFYDYKDKGENIEEITMLQPTINVDGKMDSNGSSWDFISTVPPPIPPPPPPPSTHFIFRNNEKTDQTPEIKIKEHLEEEQTPPNVSLSIDELSAKRLKLISAKKNSTSKLTKERSKDETKVLNISSVRHASCSPLVRNHSIDSSAVSFGESSNSHAKFEFNHNVMRRKLDISLEFRTFYSEGLLIYLKDKGQTEYLAIQLRDSRLQIVYYTMGDKEILSPAGLNDGKWHKVSIRKERRSLIVKLDDYEEIRAPIVKLLNVVAPGYIGGIPESYIPRPNVKTQSFKGCIRNLMINREIHDIFQSESFIGLSQCFMNVETGAHFTGDSYAIYEKNFNVGSEMEILIKFRTTQRNAVLVSIGEKDGYPSLGLSLFEGQVVFSVNMGEGLGPFKAIKKFDDSTEVGAADSPNPLGGNYICDDKWHTVLAAYVKNIITLKVDEFDIEFGFDEGNLKETKTNNFLYVGGFPDKMKNNQGSVPTHQRFIGCMKFVSIKKNKKDWENMYSLHNLNNNCPITP